MGLFKKMFDQTVEGKGVKPEPDGKFTLLKFFRLTGRKFWRICALNLFFVLTNILLIFVLIYFAGYGNVTRAAPISNYWFGVINGASKFVSNPAMSLLEGICGATVPASYPTTLSYIFLAIAALTIFTFGPANTGMAYILRNYTREEPCDLWHDYWHTIKKNLGASVLLGVIDSILLFAMTFDLYLFLTGQGTVVIFAVLAVSASVIYLTMRSYMYVILVTFDLPIIKIIKNSLIFAFVNVKRNIVAFLGQFLLALVTVLMLIYLTPLGALVLLGFVFSLSAFMGIYAGYPAIKQYMIDPVIEEERKKRKGEQPKEVEQIFSDPE